VAGAALARAGHEVHLLESDRFPRFRVGESLLPCNDPIFTDVGLDRAAIAEQGFMPKSGVCFEAAGERICVRFPFSDGLPSDPGSIFQVERSRFDQLLLENAQRQGVILHTPVRVQRVDFSAEMPVIIHSGGRCEVDFVIDASGRQTLLARQMDLMSLDGEPSRAAIYGHITGLTSAFGTQSGDLTISRADDAWAWQIPLTPDRWSVGLVFPGQEFTAERPLLDLFDAVLERFPELSQRLAGHRPIELRATPSICYHVRKRYGRRWALVGDAGGFIDPIFSSGVLIASRSAWHLARVLNEHGPDADLNDWRQAIEHDLAIFRSMIHLWYDSDFITRSFFGGCRDEDLHRGIVSLMAGNTTDLSNHFLAMLARYDAHQRRNAPRLN
jgi:flavin-dependent dehydrogenase